LNGVAGVRDGLCRGAFRRSGGLVSVPHGRLACRIGPSFGCGGQWCGVSGPFVAALFWGSGGFLAGFEDWLMLNGGDPFRFVLGPCDITHGAGDRENCIDCDADVGLGPVAHLLAWALRCSTGGTTTGRGTASFAVTAGKRRRLGWIAPHGVSPTPHAGESTGPEGARGRLTRTAGPTGDANRFSGRSDTSATQSTSRRRP
jgi:hypothetical protein